MPAKIVARERTRPKSKFNLKTLHNISSEIKNIAALAALAADFDPFLKKITQLTKAIKKIKDRI